MVQRACKANGREEGGEEGGRGRQRKSASKEWDGASKELRGVMRASERRFKG